MAEITSIHSAYRPLTPTTPSAPATNGVYAPTPAYPTTPTDAYTGAYPQTPYPAYPTTQYPAAPTAQGQGFLSSVARYVGGIFAGRDAAGIMKKAVTASRRSQSSRIYRDAYGTPIRRMSSGRARVGVSGRASSEFFGAVKTSVLVGGIASIVGNVWDVMQGRQTGATAGANIAGDVMSSAVGGAAAAGASALGTALFAGSLSATGMALPLVGMAFGLVGFMVADGVLRNTAIFQKVQTSVYNMLS